LGGGKVSVVWDILREFQPIGATEQGREDVTCTKPMRVENSKTLYKQRKYKPQHKYTPTPEPYYIRLHIFVCN